MVNIIINVSKYIIIILMALYTLSCFWVFRNTSEDIKAQKLNRQIVYVFLIHFLSYLTLALSYQDKMIQIVIFYGLQIFIATIYMYIYHYIYPNSSRIITNNMCFLLLIGYTMLTRLDFSLAKKQFVIATVSIVIVSFIPFIMDKTKNLRKYGIAYGILGIIALSSVFVIGVEQYGSVNWISIAGITVQPSEFVKILFGFFIASMLSKSRDLKQVIIITAFACVHMGILVLEKDLGGALIFFVIFITMIYVGTGKARYLIAYILGGTAMAGLAFILFKDRLFDHVMVRVNVWRDPWADISGSGYQITQSLFAIGSGGFFGTGLTKGSPEVIPVSVSDFIFSAIAEEFGVIFALLLILVCLSCFITFINIAMKVRNRFYKTMAFGFAICYIFQTFLSIGGVTKFIPSTGVTIPLISYGGSSVFSSLIMFSIMQGISTIENRESTLDEEKEEKYTKINEKLNRPIIGSAYICTFLILSLMAYILHFVITEKDVVIANAANSRLDSFAANVIRGDIETSDGKVIATNDGDKRYYPYDNLFAHVGGYSTYSKAGIELVGNYHLLESHAGVAERMLHTLREEKNAGDTVISTLNYDLQKTAYDALGSADGAVVVMEPDTGKILAMVSKPDFNPNDIDDVWKEANKEGSESSILLNRASQGMYPPGSTFKILTTLAYMRQNPKKFEDYQYNCDKEEEIFNGVRVHCIGKKIHGKEDLESALANSCNQAYADIGIDLNVNKWKDTLESFLFNKSLPYTDASAVSRFYLDNKTDKGYIPQTAFGQGDTSISPLHNAMITATIANGGLMMKPYLIDSVENYKGKRIKKYSPSSYDTLMTADEVDILTKYMRKVVSDGTASDYFSGAPYKAAGKTGTAEYDNGNHDYSWFVGFADVENPEVVVSIIVEEADVNGIRATAVARKIFDAYYEKVEKGHSDEK